MSNDLAEFLLERIGEDEASAKEASDLAELFFGAPEFEVTWSWARHTRHLITGGAGTSFADGAPSPARVLAECAAKRRIVEAYREERTRRDIYQAADPDSEGMEQARQRRSSAARCRGLEIALEALALPYADHSDFDPAWRPEQTA